MTGREAFEAWYCTLPSASDKFEIRFGDVYADSYVQTAWLGWQASRQQMAEEAAVVCAQFRNDEKSGAWKSDYTIGREFCSRDIEDAIRSLATPTEGKT